MHHRRRWWCVHGWVMRWRRCWRMNDGLFSPFFNNVARLGPSAGKFKLACDVG